MPNTIARPMSPAVGVNYDRNHMREIYQKKSIAYKCLKRCMDISLSGLELGLGRTGGGLAKASQGVGMDQSFF